MTVVAIEAAGATPQIPKIIEIREQNSLAPIMEPMFCHVAVVVTMVTRKIFIIHSIDSKPLEICQEGVLMIWNLCRLVAEICIPGQKKIHRHRVKQSKVLQQVCDRVYAEFLVYVEIESPPASGNECP
jgi:hypothetical protein